MALEKDATTSSRSAFNVKGTVYRGAFEVYETLVPGGVAALRAQLEPDLRAFAAQRFLSSAWYDLYPLAKIDAVAAQLCGLTLEAFVRKCARAQATKEFSGVYKSFIRMLSANAVATILPRLSAQFHDFGRIETRTHDGGGITVTRIGIPKELAMWLNVIGQEYVVVALELCGVHDIQLDLVAIEPDGRRGNVELVRVESRLLWTKVAR